MKQIQSETLSETRSIPVQEKDSGLIQRILRFNTHGTQYALDLNFVECVVPVMELQYVPGGPHYLAGLMNYHGKSLPVVDPGLWLGLDAVENFNLNTPIIICSDRQHQIAFVVASVMAIEAVKPEAIQMQNAFSVNHSPFKASLNLDAGMVLLLDVEYILRTNFTTSMPTV